MKSVRNYILLALVIIVSVLGAYIYSTVFNKNGDPRKYGVILESIKDLNNRKINALPGNKTMRYTLYSDFETVYSDVRTGAFMEDVLTKKYSIEDVNDLRRINNVEYIYEKDFKNRCFIKKDKYMLIKTLRDNELFIKAYLSFDPTIEEYTDFWYNGRVLTSVKSLHSFDAVSGEGLSNGKVLQSILVEEEIREINR